MFEFFFIFVLLSNSFGYLESSREVVESKTYRIGFVILSQPNEYHMTLAELLKADILNQATELKSGINVEVYRSHEDFGDVLGHWTVYPLFKKLSKVTNLDWIFFLEDQTRINVKNVLKVLASYNSSKNVFAGYALRDSDPTIIHHFATTDGDFILSYPHFSAGFFISFTLITKITGNCQDRQFSIDPKYELAKFIWTNTAIKLSHEPRLCLKKEKDECATWIKNRIPDCSPEIASEEAFVAVKTCKKFHQSRVKVLKNTWAPDVKNLLMFSDSEDLSIPTIQLNVKNVASGHCEKTLSIMKFFDDSDISFNWLVIVDDDTLLSFHRLKKLLSCYNSSHDVAIGERYGYSTSDTFGYNYPTGGSGMIFSRSVLKKLVTYCRCPSIDSPDDMIIGVCLKTLNIPLIHSPHLHQARPIDYSPEFLAPLKHISFHKHWMIDPYDVYREWLQETPHATTQHSEL